MRFLPRRSVQSIVVAALASTLLTGLIVATAQGARWSPASLVTPTRDATLTALHELAASDTALHLVHARVGPGARDDHLTYQRSTNGGRTWSRERDLFRSSITYKALFPNLAIAARGDRVIVAYRVRGPSGVALLVRVSDDAGLTFAPSVRLARGDHGRGLGVPAVTIAAGALVVAWTDRATGNILVRRSTNGGTSFGRPGIFARSALSIDCADPDVVDGLVGLASTGSTVHLAWSDGPRGACIAARIRIRTSDDSGRTFAAPRVVTGTDSFGWPELAARGRALLISLQRPTGGLLLLRSKDAGHTFTQQVLKPGAGRGLGAGDVALLGGGRAWVVYPDVRYHGSEVTTTRLVFRRSRDGGRTWGSAAFILPEAKKLREAPNVVSWKDAPVVVVQSGPVDRSHTDVWATRAT